MRRTTLALITAAIAIMGGCGGEDAGAVDAQAATDAAGEADVPAEVDAPETEPDYAGPGPWPPGHTTLHLVDRARARALTVEVWYPAALAGATGTTAEFLSDAEAPVFEGLLAEAPEGCVNLETGATRDAPAAAGGPWPLLLMSHCHNCTRFSTFSLAERLASHGFVVAAPDHADNTLWDAQDGTAIELSDGFLPTRGGDLGFLLDTLLGPDAPLPAGLSGVDPDRIGALGHSFGSVTAGYLTQGDPRVKAVAGLAAPMENPLTPGTEMAAIEVPVLFVVMVEDNSITEFGNALLRDNFANANPPAWKLEVADAGHWSLSDICGLVPDFLPCCGEAERQTDGTPFTYLPRETGTAITQNVVTGFFALTLLGDPRGQAVLDNPWPEAPALVTVETRQ